MQSGEEQKVTFKITEDMLRFYDIMISLREKNIFAESYTEKFGRHMKILTEQTMKALE
ncbi:MAG: hypothetical protein ACERKZ_06585 [Lachnotalea sp.]